jgi:lysophospholipase L1-like esterase
MLLTVLEVAQPEPKVEQQRVQLNKLLKQYAGGQAWAAAAAAAAAQGPAAGGSNAQQQQQQQGGSKLAPVFRRGQPRVVMFDLASKLTWSEMEEEPRWQIWDDGVHLTIDGYDLMGDLISDALSPLVEKDIGSAAAAAAAAAGLEGSAATANGTSDHKKAV